MLVVRKSTPLKKPGTGRDPARRKGLPLSPPNPPPPDHPTTAQPATLNGKNRSEPAPHHHNHHQASPPSTHLAPHHPRDIFLLRKVTNLNKKTERIVNTLVKRNRGKRTECRRGGRSLKTRNTSTSIPCIRKACPGTGHEGHFPSCNLLLLNEGGTWGRRNGWALGGLPKGRLSCKEFYPKSPREKGSQVRKEEKKHSMGKRGALAGLLPFWGAFNFGESGRTSIGGTGFERLANEKLPS